MIKKENKDISDFPPVDLSYNELSEIRRIGVRVDKVTNMRYHRVGSLRKR